MVLLAAVALGYQKILPNKPTFFCRLVFTYISSPSQVGQVVVHTVALAELSVTQGQEETSTALF